MSAERLQNAREQMERDHRDARMTALVWLLCFGFVLWLLTGCTSTVTQDRVPPAAASFDGNEQNSGVIQSTDAGYLVTARFQERYVALTKVYGDRFRPELRPGSGILPVGPGRWVIDREHMVKFLTMNQWDRMARAPK